LGFPLPPATTVQQEDHLCYGDKKMKKLLFLFLFLPTIAWIYGQEQQANNFDFGLTCLIAVSDDTVAPGPGLAANWYNPKLFGPVGMGAYMNLVVPVVKTEMGLAVSLLTGPSYMIFDNGTIALPVTAGIHFDFVCSSKGFTAINLGIGAHMDIVWRFGRKWHGYGRVLVAYNFGAGGEFLMFPGIGVGISF
jgi:hypothetical protein